MDQLHKAEHNKLHKSLDMLVADYILHTGRTLGNSSIMDLIMWSHSQTITPTEKP